MNKVLLTGNATREPDVRVVGQNSTAVATFGLAVNRHFGGKKETTFVDIKVWGKQAEFVEAHIHKGSALEISGRLEAEKWEDKDGNKRSKMVVVADEVNFGQGGKKKDETETTDAPDSADVPDDSVPF